MTRDEALAVLEEVARVALSYGEREKLAVLNSGGTAEGLFYVRVGREHVFSGLYDRWRDAMLALRSGPRVGDAVVTGRGEIGLLSGWAANGMAFVQESGPEGPCLRRSAKGLRRATLAEIADSHLRGVGCNQSEENGG